MTTTVKPSTSADMDNSPNSANGMENELSKLVVGAYEDLSTLSLDEPAGETADWIVITTALAQMDANFLVKVAYMLTTRGQEQKNSHKGTRIMYREGADKKLWISFATDSSSMLKTEITPGRFRTAVAGLVFVHPQLRISPVMSVIGLEVLIKQWETTSGTITAKINANDVSFPDNGVKMIDGGDTVSFSDINFPKIYALAPDRVPPHYAHVSGALELGAALALCQDMRNIILASIEQGTAAQKNRQRSEFHRSFTRRSAAMGYMVNPDIWPYICAEVITLCAANFSYRSQLDDKTRQFAQKIIDNAVQAMSKNAPEKI
ncbi:hypothetical protein SK128_009651 [Halocaridina rubra]|uniref:Uncharacterized protein n=1 Tax=Halocaridina rubra TaxID=373956 RepID=A0AAN8WY38_HALRR